MPLDHKAVLFVDVLGFASLTERFPVKAGDFALVDRPSEEDFLKVKFEALANNELIEQYTKFNMAVDHAVEWELLGNQSEVTAITFSDSAFIAVDSVYSAIGIGRSILERLLVDHVPVRCGVAYGSFIVLRFRSDLSLTAGTHSAQFVGTGVVWSHAAAELSGVKGMRILLHRSAVDVMDEPEHRAPVPELEQRTLELPPDERTNPSHVVREAIYLHSGSRAAHRDHELWESIQRMKRGAPNRAHPHYDATFASLNRMRAAFGREPLVQQITGAAGNA